METFGKEFWTPHNTVLVVASLALVAAFVAVIGYMTFIALSCLFVALLPVRKEIYCDELFGTLERQTQAGFRGPWTGKVRFHLDSAEASTIETSIDAIDGLPTEEQRELFRKVDSSYSSLWPAIRTALAKNLDDPQTEEWVDQHAGQPCLGLCPLSDGLPAEWYLLYTFDASTDDGQTLDDCYCYFVNFADWNIESVELVH